VAKFEITWLEDKSDEAVLEEIRRVAALEPDHRLTQRGFNSRSRIRSGAVAERFGSWSEATRRAGLTDALPVYSDTTIIEDLKRVSELSPNEPFTIAFYSKHGQYSGSHIKRRFGGWREALDAAGIGNRFVGPPTTERMKSQPGRAMSDEDILARIRDVSAQLGKASLAGADIEANSEVTQNLMYRRFGSVSAALRQAGVEQVSHGRRHTEDEIFENLLNVWTHYGRAPTVSEMDRPPSTVGKNTYIHRHGGWRKALKAFVERANSEADGDPALDSEQDPSVLADRADPTESPTIGVTGTSRSQPASQIGARPRVTRRAETNVKPEDRRDPSKGLRFNVFKRDQSRCQVCGRGPPASDPDCKLHLDHIVPFSKGGKTTFDNLRVLCSHCNVGRSNRFDD
jgi:5-methylcytosine-specific restriction endonuclease McrA